MAKPRKQIYTLEMYLNKVRDLDIRNDADVQRQFVWSNEQINELIVTVLTEDYIPPIVLGEEDSSQLWIVDGGQRTAALKKFRYGNYRITSAVENSAIPYKAKVRDKNGDIIVDEEGNVLWEEAVFDIKNKTYEKLPEELKKKLNEYQIEAVIHEHCDNHRISRLIKRYNEHTSMNTNQKAFTHIDNFARDIREILEGRFFIDYSEYTESEKTKGVVERVVVETIMCSNHLENWKKQTKAICVYLNSHATRKEFETLAHNLHRLEAVITDEIKGLFNSKESFLFLTLFDQFTKLGLPDEKFAEFLKAFKSELRKREVNGILFDDIDKDKGTKDKAVIARKLELLGKMMTEYLDRGQKKGKSTSKRGDDITAKDIIREYIDAQVDEGDMELYDIIADDVLGAVEHLDSERLSEQNRPSYVALVSYAVKKDMEDALKSWLSDDKDREDEYDPADQRQRFLRMKADFDEFIT